MQKSPTTSRMQKSHCAKVPLGTGVSMHDTLRRRGGAGPGQQSLRCHGKMEDHHHARTMWAHLTYLLPNA